MYFYFLFRELEREKVQARFHLMPLLQAEVDRQVLAQESRLLELQAMARAKGYEAAGQSVYNDKKNYIRSTFYV